MRFLSHMIAVCAVATMFAADATAQRRGGSGGGGRYYGGYGYGNNWNRGGYYGGYGYGNNWNRGGYYSYYPNYGYSNQYYGYSYPSYNYGYSYPSYSYSNPAQTYYSTPNTNYYSNPSTSMYQGTNSSAANVRVLVPDPSARVMIQGQEMQATGTQRDFVSPALEPGRAYTYTIGATWNANGQMVTRQKQVDVQPGQSTLVDFNVE